MCFEITIEFLKWSTIINAGILLWWVGWIMLGGDFIYRMHSRWFIMNREDFDKAHYAGMAFYKILILFFNVIPWIVLIIISD